MQFHEKLRSLRKAKGHSQTELAALAHVSMRSQQEYERGSTFPNVEYLAYLHDAGYDVSYLLTGTWANSALDREESNLLAAWHSANPTRRALAWLALTAALDTFPGARETTRSPENDRD